MKKRLISLLLVCAFCVGLLPGAVADSGTEALDVLAEAAGRSGAAASEKAKQETRIYHAREDGQKADNPEEDAGVSFNPYVFEVSGDSKVRASVKMQPGLMRTSTSNSGTVGISAPEEEMVVIGGELIDFIDNSTTPVTQGNATIQPGEGNSTGIITDANTTVVIGNSTVITPVAEKVPELLSASLDGQDLSVRFNSGVKYLADNPDPVCFKVWEYTTNATLSVGSPYTVGGKSYYPRTYAKIEAVDPMVHISSGASTTVSLTKTMDVMGRDPIPGELLYIAVEEMIENVSLGRSNLIMVQIPGGQLSFDQLLAYIPENLKVRAIDMNATSHLDLSVSWKEQTDVEMYELESFVVLNGTKVMLETDVCTIMKAGSGVPSEVAYRVSDGTSTFKPLRIRVLQAGEAQKTGDGTARGVRDGDTIVVTLTPFVGTYEQAAPPAVKEFTVNLSGEPTVITLNGNNTTIRLTPEKGVYTGEQIKPAAEVLYNQGALLQDRDYTVEYGENINAGSGSGSVTVIGKGDYNGNCTVAFDIDPAEMNVDNTVITLSNTTFIATGGEIKPEVVSVTVGGRTLTTDDYLVSYADNIEVGTGTVTVTGKRNYTGAVKKTFEIIEGENTEPITLTKDNTRLTITPKSKNYSGKEYKPKVKVVCNGQELTQNTDYTLSYSNNTNAGTAYAIVTGKGRYTGQVKGKFTIKKIKNELKDKIKPLAGKVAYPRGTKIKLVIKLKQKVSSDKIRFSLTKVEKLNNKDKSTQKIKKKDWGFSVSKTGTVTVKKNAKKGTYYLTFKIIIGDDGQNYKKTTITQKYKIKVK